MGHSPDACLLAFESVWHPGFAGNASTLRDKHWFSNKADSTTSSRCALWHCFFDILNKNLTKNKATKQQQQQQQQQSSNSNSNSNSNYGVPLINKKNSYKLLGITIVYNDLSIWAIPLIRGKL